MCVSSNQGDSCRHSSLGLVDIGLTRRVVMTETFCHLKRCCHCFVVWLVLKWLGCVPPLEMFSGVTQCLPAKGLTAATPVLATRAVQPMPYTLSMYGVCKHGCVFDGLSASCKFRFVKLQLADLVWQAVLSTVHATRCQNEFNRL